MASLTTMTSEKKTAAKLWLDAWHVSPSVNRDYDFIDGLRGVAILMVVVGHYFYVNPHSGGTIQLVGALIGTGGYGVTLFYALSGFLIAWPFWKRKVSGQKNTVPRGYTQRRFWKIYPPLALSILVLTPLYILVHSDWSYLALAAKWLTGWAFFMPVSGKMNPVMWTLVIEVQFYITLPLLFLCLKRVPPKVTLAIITILFLLVPLGMRVITGKVAAFYPTIDTHYPAALDAFSFGILIAGLENLGLIKKSWVGLGLAGCVLWPVVLILAAWISVHSADLSFVTTEILHAGLRISAACLILFIAQPQHPVARLLCAPWLRWCGIISYEWYLLHQPLAIWSRVYLGPAGGSPLKYAMIVGLPLVLSLIISAVAYRYFSLPILRFGRGKNQH